MQDTADDTFVEMSQGNCAVERQASSRFNFKVDVWLLLVQTDANRF